ncbi:MBL fold metallo-hydrolase [Kurthia zopfii]|uniref:Glyoxylase-like metal-dependent hydrolase (Beta-lactamase superfamily II) n=1 Tax=Kurthia zopfii TaxID=1650 RepID=A0A8B4Q9L9_9BACL|nr:MBL fold metallo-hydrolase [Kurthia zopfii]PWI22196.1 MBL fold metallo-hydrolase [Kurthia zopfii]TDR37407.1 glyoxylase-like metal-dependent hydrolase (beta-lactamase superfamily II) [Kurthia zopfii]GEK30699.1 MBL fold metallo-hydrolase [Kurthia zopfii]STX09419.1 hydroxyacylglutathione hydrolase [Kurthia zopfii]
MEEWFTVQKLDENTYAISEWGHWEKVHTFLLIGDTEAVLIDTGLGLGDLKAVVESITTLPIIVATTHIHTDHIGNHQQFDTHYVHEAEVEWLEKGIPGRAMADIKKDLVRDCTKEIPATFNLDTFELYKGKPARVLKDQDTIDFGGRQLTVLHTPGHSPGHVCYFEKETGYLFTGDLFYLETPIYAFYPSTNPENLIQSLGKIVHLENIQKIYGSHNTLSIPLDCLAEITAAIVVLQQKDVIRFGTGIHQFSSFSFQF